MKCLSCGSEVPYDADKCPDCGESVQKQMQLTAASDTNAYSVKPALSTPTNKIQVTYDSLGSKKDYALKNGALLWCAVKILIPLLSVLFAFVISRKSEAIVPAGIFAALPFIFRLAHAANASKCIKSEDYESAWLYAQKTTVLMMISLIITCGIAMGESNNYVAWILAAVLYIIMAATVVFCKAHTDEMFRIVQNTRLKELGKHHAAEEGRTIEENDVQPINRTANTLLALTVPSLLAFGTILVVMFQKPAVTWLSIILFFGVLALIAVWGIRRKHRWKQEGLLCERQKKFYLETTTFITQKTSFDRVIEEIKNCDFATSKTHWETGHDGRIAFTGYGELFKGVLSELSADDPDKSKFAFNFKDLQGGHGVGIGLSAFISKQLGRDVAMYEDYMNLCLTQIEQAIKRVDANAEIKTGSS